MQEQPTLILAFADYRTDHESHLRELGNEQDQMVKALRPAVDAGLCRLEVIANATVSSIMEAFQRAGGSVVGFHFAGHGAGFELMLANQSYIDGAGFAKYLGKQPQLKFVFLNACATYGHANLLHQAGVPITIVTESLIQDEIAKELATSFYRYLGQGNSIINAFNEYQFKHEISGTSGAALRAFNLTAEETPGFPWQILSKPGRESTLHWSLTEASNNYLFNLDLPENFPIPNRPFLSINRFKKEHARIFFGRGKEIRDLANKLTGKGFNQVLLFYGQSGVGKSSLLEAGLLPRLEDKIQIAYLRRDKETPTGLLLKNLLRQKSGAQSLPLKESWMAIERQHAKPFVVILDQVEEIFTRASGNPDEELESLMQVIQEIFLDAQKEISGKLILSYRKEYHGDIERAFEEKGIPFTKTFIEKLDKNGIIEATNGVSADPVLKAHFKLEIASELPAIIADDLQDDEEGAIAPVLQILLDQMWQATDPDQPRFSLELYRKLKSQGILLHDFLDKQIQVIGQWNPKVVESGLVNDLLFFFTTPFGTADIHTMNEVLSRYQDREKIVLPLIEKLSDCYLLAFLPERTETGEPVIRLAHDTLVPPIHTRYERSSKPGQNADRILSNLDLKDWKKSPERYLLNEEQVQTISQGRSGMRMWSPEEAELIQQSKQTIARRKRNQRILRIAAVAIVGIIAVLLAFLYQAEKEKRKLAEAGSLEAQADATTDPTQKKQLLEQSLTIIPDNKERLQKLALVNANNLFYQKQFEQPDLLRSIFSPGGRYLAVESGSGATFKIDRFEKIDGKWAPMNDLSSRPGNPLNQLRYTNSGDYLFGGGTDRQIHMWKLNGDSLPSPRLNDIIQHLTLVESSMLVVASFQNKDQVKLWDVNKQTFVDSIAINHNVTDMLSIPKSGKVLVSFENGSFWTMNTASGRIAIRQEMTITTAAISRMYLSPNTQLVYLGFANGEIGQLDLATNKIKQQIFPEWQAPQSISDLCVSQDKRFLIASASTSAYLFRLADHKLLYELIGHQSNISSIAFNEAGTEVSSVGLDEQIFSWPLPDLGPQHTLFEGLRAHAVSLLEMEGTTTWAGTTRDSVVISNWPSNNSATIIFDQHQMDVTALSMVDRHVLSGDQEGVVYYWEIEQPEQAKILDAHFAAITDLAISPNLDQCLTAGEDGLVLRWSLPEGTLIDTLPHAKPVQQIVWIKTDEAWTFDLNGDIQSWNIRSSSDPISNTSKISMGTSRQIVSGYPLSNALVVSTSSDSLFTLDFSGKIRQAQSLSGKVNYFQPSSQAPAVLIGGTDDGHLLWLNDRGQIIHQMANVNDSPVLNLNVSGNQMLVGNENGTIQLWQLIENLPK